MTDDINPGEEIGPDVTIEGDPSSAVGFIAAPGIINAMIAEIEATADMQADFSVARVKQQAVTLLSLARDEIAMLRRLTT